MSIWLLIGSVIALIAGASVLGWLARWFKYGGRCGADGLGDGIPNVDMERGTVALDGSEPVVAMDAAVDAKRSEASEATRAALGTLKAGYSDGRREGRMPDAPGDDSTAARLAAVAGVVTTKVGSTLEDVTESVKETALRAAESTKSKLSSASESFSKGKKAGDAGDEPGGDGSVAAKTGAAASAVGSGLASAADAAKDAVTRAGESTKSALSSVRKGYGEGKASDETPDTPADGSTSAKLGAVVGGAAAAVGSGLASVADTVKGAAEKASDGTKSALSSAKAGFSDGKASEDMADDTTGGSAMAKAGAVVGGATAAVGAGLARATETAKDAASKAAETTQSAVSSVKDGLADARSPDAASGGSSSRDLAGQAGATLGQEDGHSSGTEGSGQVSGDAKSMRARFTAVSEEADAGGADDFSSEALSDAEMEAQLLIESGETASKPVSALDAPQEGRKPDDLKRIKGIGNVIEAKMNGNGIYYYEQIAAFSGRDLAWADQTLDFKGRAVRDRWIPQARDLAAEK
jgi:predicted flap endonuclease-1-like 5' DNA nuclease